MNHLRTTLLLLDTSSIDMQTNIFLFNMQAGLDLSAMVTTGCI